MIQIKFTPNELPKYTFAIYPNKSRYGGVVMKFGVIYCLGITEDVIQDIEIIEAENLEEAVGKSERNMEFNLVFPLTNSNKKGFRNLLTEWVK